MEDIAVFNIIQRCGEKVDGNPVKGKSIPQSIPNSRGVDTK